MKAVSLSFLIAVAVCAQNAPHPENAAPERVPVPVTVTPSAPQQSPAALTAKPVTPNTVVAKVGGKDYTAADLDKLLADLPPQVQSAIARQPQQFLTQMFLIRSLAQQAEFENLDKDPRWRQQFEMQRMQLLAQAEVTKHRESIRVTDADMRAWYEQNKDEYRVAKVKAIYISFVPPPAAGAAQKPEAKAPEGRTEEQAKAKIEELRRQIEAGADFSKVARENSDDKATAEKGGDYGEVTPASSSEKIRIAVFKLKPGEVSEPVKESRGYYLFKMEDLSYQPYDKVETQIQQQIQQGEFQSWIRSIEARNKVTVENPTYFATRNAR